VLLKTRGPEATSSEAALSEAVSFRSCIIRSYVIKLPHQKSFHQKLNINWICKDSRIEESSLQKLSIGFENTTKD
jgi:hypothetical protein